MAKKKLSSVVGIDIGSQTIKVAELQNRGREVVVNALGIAPTPDGLVDHNGVYDTDVIGAVVKELCQKSGISVGNAVFSIAGQASILVRTLEVPKMNPAELKQHMEWEISRNQPFAELTVQSDYKAFPVSDPAAQNMDVVMAIAAQSAVDTLMGIGKRSGKAVHAIDVEPLAVARALKADYSELGAETICVIEIGHKSTSINVYRDGQLLLPRQVPVGGENITQALAMGLGVSNEEAEKIKCEQARIPDSAGNDAFSAPSNPFLQPVTQEFQPYNPFADDAAFSAPAPAPAAPAADAEPYAYNPFGEPAAPAADEASPFATPQDPSAPVDPYAQAPAMSPFDESGNPVDPAEMAPPPLAPAVDATPAPAQDSEETRIYAAMAREVDEFVAEVRRSLDYFRSKGGDVNRIFLAGGGAKLAGLPEFLTRVLGVQCEMMDPLKGLPLTGKRLDMTMVEAHRPDFLVAIGNGLHIAFD